MRGVSRLRDSACGCARRFALADCRSRESLVELAAAASALGLVLRGSFRPTTGEAIAGPSGTPAACLVLLGAVGDSHWPAFSASDEAQDGRPDPLDRWSRRLIEGLAHGWRARALFPFDGPPFWPFQRWAVRAEPVHLSPLGLLIHPRYGLWHSYRGALAFDRLLEGLPEEGPAGSAAAAGASEPSPCVTCEARPCLSACPVAAFVPPPVPEAPAFDVPAFDVPAFDAPAFHAPGRTGYDTVRCGTHLAGPQGDACLEAACLARAACPVGVGHRYGSPAARFHLGAFKASLEVRARGAAEATAERED